MNLVIPGSTWNPVNRIQPKPASDLASYFCIKAQSRYSSEAIGLPRRPCMGTSVFVVVSLRHDTGYKLREGIARGKKGISATIQPCIRTPCISARSRRPSLPDTALRVPCRAPGATGTSGTRKSDSTGATPPYKPEIQYGYNKRCVLKLRSLRYHYNDREDKQKNKNRNNKIRISCSRMKLEEIQESRDITETTDILAERKKEEG
jgi:hypothetical protein